MQNVNGAAVAAAWGVLLAGAAGVMKTTDLVRSWIEEHLSFTPPSYTWILVPFGVGIVTCLTSHLNPLLAFFPALPHTYGEVLSGIALGGIASPLHHGTALLSAKSNAVVPTTPPNDVPGDGQDVMDLAFGPDQEPTEGEPGPADTTGTPPAPGGTA